MTKKKNFTEADFDLIRKLNRKLVNELSNIKKC